MASGKPPEPTFESRTPDWLALDEARRRVLAVARPLEVERVPLADALGRALAEPASASATLPPWDNSAMDGYAVRADDIAGASEAAPVILPVTSLLRAGDVPTSPLEPGQAIRIMTGAPLPAGADSVVRVEDTDRESTSGMVRILADRDAGRHVRPAGQDMVAGQLVLDRGASIHAGTIGVLAALGCADVPVHRRPVVGVVATGDELRPPDRYDDVRSGIGIPEANGPMIGALVARAGATPRHLGIAPDTRDALRDRLADGLDGDAIVTLGGASMGEADLVKSVLDEMGFRQDFWRVRIRPGSPFGFGSLPGRRGDLPVFSLPGNPASAFVTFEVFVRPFLLRLMGHRRVHRRVVRCVAGAEMEAPGRRAYLLRVQVDTSRIPPVAGTVGPQGSGLVRTLSAAQGLAVVPESVESVAEGEEIDVMLLDDTTSAVEPAPIP